MQHTTSYSSEEFVADQVFNSKSDLQEACSTPFRSDLIGGSEPVPECSFNSFYLPFYLFYFFQKCRDSNPRPDPNDGSKLESGLLRPFLFILSKTFYLCHLILEFSITRKHFKCQAHKHLLVYNTFTK